MGRGFKMLDIEVLGSSSKGNCYILRTKESTLILECGINYKEILNALKYDLSNVVGCLVTHEHLDHSKSMKDLMKSGIDVYASAGTFEANNITGHRVKLIEAKRSISVAGFSILPFDVQHDAKEPLGFLIYHPEFGKLLFATDTYYIHYKFAGLSHIMVECNYSAELLKDNLESGKLNPFMKKRLLASHFSLENVKKFLLANNLKNVESIMLMHLSDGNSNANNFKNEIERLTGIPVRIC